MALPLRWLPASPRCASAVEDLFYQYVRLLENLPPMEQSGGISAFGYLSSLFRDPLLIDVLAATSMKMELRRESLPLFTFAHVNSSFIQSSWRLQGGGARIVESLVDDIRQALCLAKLNRIRTH